jgi:hypothetical protein
MTTTSDPNLQIKSLLASMPQAALKSALVEAAVRLPESDKKDVAQGIQGILPLPSKRTNNTLWVIVLSAFSLVLMGTAATIAIGMFTGPAAGATKPELVLTMFTSVVGFMAGVFVPSPADSSKS